MSFVPKFESACDLASNTPEMVAEFLDLRTKLARDRNETSVTDLLVACLLKLSQTEVTVIVPNETITGADFDILLLNENVTDAIQYRIQAKKLCNRNVKNWEYRSYAELDHPKGTGDQARLLVRSSAHEKVETIPLYMFYNDAETCELSGGSIAGISLADGVTVSRLVKRLVEARPKRLHYKRVGALSNLFFPFSTILCPPSDSPTQVLISPSNSRRATEAALARTRSDWGVADRKYGDGDQYEVSRDRLPLPPKLIPAPKLGQLPEPTAGRDASPEQRRTPVRREPSLLPVVVQDALSRRGTDGIVRASVKRPKVVLRPV